MINRSANPSHPSWWPGHASPPTLGEILLRGKIWQRRFSQEQNIGDDDVELPTERRALPSLISDPSQSGELVHGRLLYSRGSSIPNVSDNRVGSFLAFGGWHDALLSPRRLRQSAPKQGLATGGRSTLMPVPAPPESPICAAPEHDHVGQAGTSKSGRSERRQQHP
jgi:hypothetical protein